MEIGQTRFSAKTTTGSARGKSLGTPTINMDKADVPATLEEGIYACWVKIGNEWMMGAMHHGPRPVFNDTPSTEVYLLDRTIEELPPAIEVATVKWLRPVMNFPSKEELMARIATDVEQARKILSEHSHP